jgi:hypothetical protein
MILIKSLIVIFILLLLAKYATPILVFLSNLFDGREGFVAEDDEEEVQSYDAEASAEEPLEEVVYTPPTVMEKHDLLSKDSTIVGDLQDKMNELMQLSEKATEINNQLNLNIFK